MQILVRSIFVLFLLGFFTVASAQLPPKVIADKYLTQVEQLLEKQDYEAALNMVEKIIALQKEHNLTLSDNLYFKDAVAQLLEKKDYMPALNIMDKFIALQKEHSLTLPHEFHFQYAQIAFSTGSIQTAFESVSKYLSAEKEGESYKEALALLIKIEEEFKELEKFEVLEFSPENTCIGKPDNSRCWMALTNQPECYVWNPILEKEETVTWTGECSEGFAQGMGTLIHNYINRDTDYSIGRTKTEEIGQLQNGKRHGHWVKSYTYSTTYKDSGNGYQVLAGAEGPYIEGKKHGYWVTRVDSTIQEEGPYVDGKRHGEWILYFWDGSAKGSVREKGPYVNNKKHGEWTVYAKEGYVSGKGLYLSGKRHGEWSFYDKLSDTSTTTTKGSYVDGKKQGHWATHFPNGVAAYEGAYVEGNKHGFWIYRGLSGRFREKGPYVNGNRHGEWLMRYAKEYGEGSEVRKVTYVNGRKQ